MRAHGARRHAESALGLYLGAGTELDCIVTDGVHGLRSDDAPNPTSSSTRTDLTLFWACHYIRMTRVGFTPDRPL